MMDFDQTSKLELFGKISGFLFSFILFNVILNLVLALSGQFTFMTRPLYVLGFTLIVIGLGLSIRRYLE
jgi:hypothetical protein